MLDFFAIVFVALCAGFAFWALLEAWGEKADAADRRAEWDRYYRRRHVAVQAAMRAGNVRYPREGVYAWLDRRERAGLRPPKRLPFEL